jgi:hypothetical protein
MDRRRFFTAAGSTVALSALGAGQAFAQERAAAAGAHFDADTIKTMRDRIRPVDSDEFPARREHARR